MLRNAANSRHDDKPIRDTAAKERDRQRERQRQERAQMQPVDDKDSGTSRHDLFHAPVKVKPSVEDRTTIEIQKSLGPFESVKQYMIHPSTGQRLIGVDINNTASTRGSNSSTTTTNTNSQINNAPTSIPNSHTHNNSNNNSNNFRSSTNSSLYSSSSSSTQHLSSLHQNKDKVPVSQPASLSSSHLLNDTSSSLPSYHQQQQQQNQHHHNINQQGTTTTSIAISNSNQTQLSNSNSQQNHLPNTSSGSSKTNRTFNIHGGSSGTNSSSLSNYNSVNKGIGNQSHTNFASSGISVIDQSESLQIEKNLNDSQFNSSINNVNNTLNVNFNLNNNNLPPTSDDYKCFTSPIDKNSPLASKKVEGEGQLEIESILKEMINVSTPITELEKEFSPNTTKKLPQRRSSSSVEDNPLLEIRGMSKIPSPVPPMESSSSSSYDESSESDSDSSSSSQEGGVKKDNYVPFALNNSPTHTQKWNIGAFLQNSNRKETTTPATTIITNNNTSNDKGTPDSSGLTNLSPKTETKLGSQTYGTNDSDVLNTSTTDTQIKTESSVSSISTNKPQQISLDVNQSPLVSNLSQTGSLFASKAPIKSPRRGSGVTEVAGTIAGPPTNIIPTVKQPSAPIPNKGLSSSALTTVYPNLKNKRLSGSSSDEEETEKINTTNLKTAKESKISTRNSTLNESTAASKLKRKRDSSSSPERNIGGKSDDEDSSPGGSKAKKSVTDRKKSDTIRKLFQTRTRNKEKKTEDEKSPSLDKEANVKPISNTKGSKNNNRNASKATKATLSTSSAIIDSVVGGKGQIKGGGKGGGKGGKGGGKGSGGKVGSKGSKGANNNAAIITSPPPPITTASSNRVSAKDSQRKTGSKELTSSNNNVSTESLSLGGVVGKKPSSITTSSGSTNATTNYSRGGKGNNKITNTSTNNNSKKKNETMTETVKKEQSQINVGVGKKQSKNNNATLSSGKLGNLTSDGGNNKQSTILPSPSSILKESPGKLGLTLSSLLVRIPLKKLSRKPQSTLNATVPVPSSNATNLKEEKAVRNNNSSDSQQKLRLHYDEFRTKVGSTSDSNNHENSIVPPISFVARNRDDPLCSDSEKLSSSKNNNTSSNSRKRPKKKGKSSPKKAKLSKLDDSNVKNEEDSEITSNINYTSCDSISVSTTRTPPDTDIQAPDSSLNPPHYPSPAVVPQQPIYLSYFEKNTEHHEEYYTRDQDTYLEEAKRLKHRADNERVSTSQASTYLEAGLYFILTGISMERDRALASYTSKSGGGESTTTATTAAYGSNAAYTMYKDTLSLIRYIGNRFRNRTEYSSAVEAKIIVLSLRCQSMLHLKLFKIKMRETKEGVQYIIDHYSKQPPDPPMLNSPQLSTPSPHSPTSSPAGPSGTHSHNPPPSNHLVQQVPRTIYSQMYKQCSNIMNIINAHELWESADQMVEKYHIEEFFIGIDRKYGSLTLHNSLVDLVRYVKLGLQVLKNNADIT